MQQFIDHDSAFTISRIDMENVRKNYRHMKTLNEFPSTFKMKR